MHIGNDSAGYRNMERKGRLRLANKTCTRLLYYAMKRQGYVLPLSLSVTCMHPVRDSYAIEFKEFE